MHQLNLTMSSICQFFLFMLLINANNIFPRSGDKIDLTISDTGLNLKNFHIKWTPKNKVFDAHDLKLREFKFSFADIDVDYQGDSLTTNTVLNISGPNIIIKGLNLNSKMVYKDWIIDQKINRMKKRESIARASILKIVNSIDLFNIDNNKLPSTLNDLIVNKYITRESYPLNDYTWSYELLLPEYVVAKPTQLNVIPDADKVRYDWKTRKFQVNPILDSLNKIPDANWNYIFEIQEISQILDSKILLKKDSKTLGYDFIMERGQFKILGTSFVAIPNKNLNSRSSLSLPELVLDVEDLIFNGSLGTIPTIHKIGGKFRFRNFEIKIPGDLKNEPEIEKLFETIGIWNNSIVVRLLELEIEMINQFTGNVAFKFTTPFLKINVKGDFTSRQSGKVPDIRLHNTEIKINPVALGVRKWLRNWEKEKGRSFNRVGSTIILKLEGSLSDPIITGF